MRQSWIAAKAAQFAGDRNGNFAIMFGMIGAVLVLVTGFGINTLQLANAKSALRAAVDSAVTSTARGLTIGDIEAKDAEKTIKAFIAANSGGGILDYDTIVLDDLTINPTAKTVSVTAHVDVPLYFPLFGSEKTRRLSNTSAAVYSDKKIEVAMMLDVTGSMGGQKIVDLRNAAKNAVNAMLGNQNPKIPRVRVAIIPYASGVNVGGLSANVYAETSSSPDLPPVEGSSLLVAKTGKKTLPSFSDYVSIVAAGYPNQDGCATERKNRNGGADLSADGPDQIRTDNSGKRYFALVNRDNRLSGSGMNKCPDARIIPLTTDPAPLLDSIKDFQANGYTGGAIGVQWAYYMLSSSWQGAIQSANLGDGPSGQGPKKISKVAILMTDGQFNTAYAGVSGTNTNNQGTVSRTNAEGICSNMKTEGIQVFTIGFDLNNKNMSTTERDQAKSVLKNCSSADTSAVKHYYEASTGKELDAAFQEIIRNTESVALTQ